MRLAVVVQRYGVEITGGAELHARLVCEHLAPSHDITVLTTCARDYITWNNSYPRGIADVNGLPVWRFPVSRSRDPVRFGKLQERVFCREHSLATARAWLDAQGPYTPAMSRWIRRNKGAFDYFICFSYRYWTTFEAMRAVPNKVILVPTAEPDPAVEIPLFHSMFRDARAIVYNSHEERDMIIGITRNQRVPGDVVGVGIIEPPETCGERFRAAYGIEKPYVLYLGRIDDNKGCPQLFDYYTRLYASMLGSGTEPPLLILAGSAAMEIPIHPGIRYLGRVDEHDKYAALAGALCLVMPSFYESLSMVLLEAWAVGRPVLVNGHCDVLRGQTVRSRGGLYYLGQAEFGEALRVLSSDARLCQTMGQSGRTYYESNYRWPVIESKYEAILEQLAAVDANGGATG